MKEKIVQMLDAIEKKHGIRIIYAVESGSRAWGFASKDSDYDVRYIYIRPVRDYLSLVPFKDTIEGPLDEIMDFSGWDIRKTLGLLRKTNPSLIEWIGSPIVYRTTPEWESVSSVFPQFFDPTANAYHYLSMATTNRQKHLQSEKIKLKKYFYVLRPILCCRWLEIFSTVPPVPFQKLCDTVLPVELNDIVDDLLLRKQTSDEKDFSDHIPALDVFIDTEIPRLQNLFQSLPKKTPCDYKELDDIFFRLIAVGEHS